MTTLAERLQLAMDAKPGASQAGLARHCHASAASVSNWFTGETKTLKAQSLVLAAEYFAVRPRWLLDGRGPMRATGPCKPDGDPTMTPPALAAALPVVLSRLPGLPDYTASKVLNALHAAIRAQAPLEQIERDLLQWLSAPAQPGSTPGKQPGAA